MTQEQKARAYDGAIKKAKEIKEKIVHSHLSTESCKAVSEYIDTIIPELAESEDEKIRKELMSTIQHAVGTNGVHISEELEKRFLTWLEKQKDASKAIKAVERIDKYIDTHTANAHDMDDSNPDKKYYSGVDDTLSDIAGILNDSIMDFDTFDVVDAEFDAREPRDNWEYIKEFCDKFGRLPKDIDELNALVSYVRDKKQKEQKDYNKLYEDIANSEWFKKAYAGKTFGCDYEQKEQKSVILEPDETEFPYNHPVNTLEGEIKNIWSKLSSENTFVASFEGFREVILHFVNFVQKEQKPAEWSKEEEKHLYNAIEAVKSVYDVSAGSSGAQCIEFLKSIPERLNIQPKQEWSEEDKEMLARVFELIRYADDHYEFDGKEVSSVDVKAWLLKSLCPQPKREWSKEDKDKIEDILLIIKHATNIPYSGGILTINNEYKDKLSKFLKSFVPNAEN